MDAERAERAFRDYLEGKGLNEKDLSLSSFVSIFIGYYNDVQFPELDPASDGDLLLFQYGTYDWGEGRYFEVDFTRQFYEVFHENDDHEIYQQRFTFYFAPAQFESVASFKTWSSSHQDLEDFESAIKQSVGYSQAII
jgi:hypothetical protein